MTELLRPTPSQTIGPFFHFALPWTDGGLLVAPDAPGAVHITGQVTDGADQPVIDALVEIWQADPAGHYAHPDDPEPSAFVGFGRVPTDAGGRFDFTTLKPGPVPGPSGSPQAPHLSVSVFARGLLARLSTRIYFPDEIEANASDPVLASVPPARRATLVAVAEGDVLRFDIHLQGEMETIFFAV